MSEQERAVKDEVQVIAYGDGDGVMYLARSSTTSLWVERATWLTGEPWYISDRRFLGQTFATVEDALAEIRRVADDDSYEISELTDKALIEARATELSSALYQLGALSDYEREISDRLQAEVERRGLMDKVYQLVEVWRDQSNPEAEEFAPRRVPPPTEPYAPRPLWTRALIALRRGLRLRRILDNLAWYRQARPRLRPLFFGASDCHGTLVASSVRPLAGPVDDPDCAWCGGPAERALPGACTALCPACIDAWLHGAADTRKARHRRPGRGYRAIYTKPLWRSTGYRAIKSMRINRRTWQWKRRTRLHLRAGTLHYLATRRYAAQQCRRWGFQHIKPGVWYDQEAGRVYLQADTIEPCEHIQLGAA